jgi:hypothetical protein
MENKKSFDFDIVKISRGLETHPWHTMEVVGIDSIELNVFGYSNPIEVFSKWANKAQKEYTKSNRTDARDSYFFRYPVQTEMEEE